MTHKHNMIAALERRIPEYVPTFELEFQLEEEMFGRKFITSNLAPENLTKLSSYEKEKEIRSLAEYMVFVYDQLDYASIPLIPLGVFKSEREIPTETQLLVKYLREIIGDSKMIHFHGDGTFAIPDGNDMYGFAYQYADDPGSLKEKASQMAKDVIVRNKLAAEIGIDCLILCSDYCYNTGPFISPQMFSELITPYLFKIIESARKDGLYVIKHTDGNIMPILDQLVQCNPHAIHSLDPMAGIDIKEIKKLVGDQVCLCGNVNCALMQTGTEDEVRESGIYCLTHAKPNGGYIFTTSNIPFSGLPLERYQLVLDIWNQMKYYKETSNE